MTVSPDTTKTVFWHRELPPLDAEAAGEYTLEASSHRIPGRIATRDEIWDQCYDDLMAEAHRRLQQEMARLGGDCVHVRHESIDSRHDDATGETWLHGCFTYVLYTRTRAA